MKTINFSNKNNKELYISAKKSCNKKNNLITPKRLNIYIMIIVFIFISIFPINIVQAGNQTIKYTQKVTSGIDSFPESYKKLLKQFVDETFHDNWSFQAYYTGINWADFVAGEKERNRVYHGFDVAHRCTCGSLESGYYCANSEITSYFMDPRNFINERNLFQFLEISYNESLYTRQIVEKLVKKYEVFNYGNSITFVMSDEKHKDYNKEVTMTYTDIIMDAAKISQMSPISMIVKIVQEVGASGSGSTDGKHKVYPNTYNFFNIGSADAGDAILNGLKYADNNGWHCPYTSIVEGAEFNSKNYIKAGQNTAYFYKYDCVGTKILKAGETQTITSNDLYHQYMTNIQDPYSQSASLFNTYLNNDLLDEKLNFIIPVFNNMPEEPIDKISSLSNSDKDLYYADITSSLYIRDSASASSNIISTIYKDDLVVMLQRNYNSSWDKVQLWDGQVGYTMTKYLQPYVPNEEENNGNTNGGTNGGNNNGTTGGTTGGTNNGTGSGNTGGTNNGTGGENSGNDSNVTQQPLAHIGYGYADVSTTLNVRKGAGTSYGIEASLSAKQEFIILEETNNWYKIRFDNNKTGYVSKDYVKSLNYIKVDDKSKQITVIPGITADIVAGKLKAKKYEIKKSGVEILDNSLGTGYVIKLDDKEYTIIKAGDVNGDVEVDVIDLALLKRHLIGSQLLKDNFIKAGILERDKKEIDIIDLALLKRFLIGTTNISL